MVVEFRANLNLVNKRLAEESHKGTSFDPEKRAAQEIEGFGQYVNGVYDNLKKYAKTEAQKEFLNSEMDRFQRGFAQKYNDHLAAEGRTISSFITGGSNFPIRRAEKANEAERKRYEEMIEYRDKAQAAILRELKKTGVEEAGGEVEVLKKKIADAERNHEFMVQANVIVRKKLPDDQKVREIMALGKISETTAREILKPDFMGRFGFPAYALSNDTANIARMKQRLKELEKKEVTETSEIPFTSGIIIDSREMDRVQIIFDQKPPESILSKLRGEGWRWSPSNSAWQRKRTPQALQSAMRITGAILPTTPVTSTQATCVQAAKYKLGQMVYSYQNPTIAAPIIAIHLSSDPQCSHTYILRIPGSEGRGTKNSNNINEESLSETPIPSAPAAQPPAPSRPRPTSAEVERVRLFLVALKKYRTTEELVQQKPAVERLMQQVPETAIELRDTYEARYAYLKGRGRPAKEVLAEKIIEDYYFGTMVTVEPEIGEPYEGTIKRLLNNGTLVEVNPRGTSPEATFRIDIDRVYVYDLKTRPLSTEELRKKYQGGKKMYRYYYRNRPPSIGTQPAGFISTEAWMPRRTTPQGHTAFGWVEYDRPLTTEEISSYELFEDEPTLPKLVAELVQFASAEGIDEAMKEVDSEYGGAVLDWLRSQRRIRAGVGQKEQIRAEIMRLAGISAVAPPPAPIKITPPQPTPAPINLFEQTANRIRSAQTIEELERIRSESKTLPLFANERVRLLDLYNSRYSVLQCERPFGQQTQPPLRKPTVLGITPQEEQRRKAQQKLTTPPPTRLSKFGIQEKAGRYYTPRRR